MVGSAKGLDRTRTAESAERKLPEMQPTPEEGVRLIRAFWSVGDSATRAAIIDLFAAVAKESSLRSKLKLDEAKTKRAARKPPHAAV
jgi:hypothetical protein